MLPPHHRREYFFAVHAHLWPGIRQHCRLQQRACALPARQPFAPPAAVSCTLSSSYAGDLVASHNNYVRRHNVLTDWIDTCALSQRYNSVPFSDITRGFWHDAHYHAFANFNDIDPSLINDMHNPFTDPWRAIRNADSWLHSHLPAILSQPYFQAGGDGQLWIIFDEGNLYPKADNRNGGGRALVLLLGPQAARGRRSTVFHNDQNLLRTWGISMGFGTLPGGATTFGALGELFAQ